MNAWVVARKGSGVDGYVAIGWGEDDEAKPLVWNTLKFATREIAQHYAASMDTDVEYEVRYVRFSGPEVLEVYPV